MALEFLIRYKESNLNGTKGETVYYAEPKSTHWTETEEVLDTIVDATSLARGDIKNAITSLAEVLANELSMGRCVDLGELGTFRLEVRSKYERSPEDVTVEDTLKMPRIVFYPKRRMLRKVLKVKMSIDHSMVMPARTRAKKKED
ncbi:MAG: DNA-binding protein [Prevotellaceae bacterium]|nr:DNA-binding protein [Prevotellaceae bacterium]